MMLKIEPLLHLRIYVYRMTIEVITRNLPTIFSSLKLSVSMTTVIWSGGDVVISNKYSGMEGSEGEGGRSRNRK